MLRGFQTYEAFQEVINYLANGELHQRKTEGTESTILDFIHKYGRVALVELEVAFDLSSLRLEENDSQALYPNNLTDPSYKKALENGAALRGLVKKTMEDNRLDAFVYPHQQVLVTKIADNGQPGRNGILASIAQTPAITVPGGFSTLDANAPQGIPVGIEFMGLQWSEPTLLEIAYSYEQATKHRQAPKVTP